MRTTMNVTGSKVEKKQDSDVFTENPMLLTFAGFNFDDYKSDIKKNEVGKEQTTISGETCACDTSVIEKVYVENSPDPEYVYKKEFLSLAFNQTEDQSSIDYKKRLLSKKVMKDKTFSMNKVFEFTFDDKIKNFIAATLEKEPVLEKLNKEDIMKMNEKTDKEYDNDFIINLCQNRFTLEELYGPKQLTKHCIQEKNEGQSSSAYNIIEEEEQYSNNEEKFEIDSIDKQIVYNLNKDVELDTEILDFFNKFIETHPNTTISSKIQLMIKNIFAKSEKTGKEILTNEMKNMRLRFWKNEYDNHAKQLAFCQTITSGKEKHSLKKNTARNIIRRNKSPFGSNVSSSQSLRKKDLSKSVKPTKSTLMKTSFNLKQKK